MKENTEKQIKKLRELLRVFIDATLPKLNNLHYVSFDEEDLQPFIEEIHAAVQQAKKDTAMEIITYLNNIEVSKYTDASMDVWKLFKGIRNHIRDIHLAEPKSEEKNKSASDINVTTKDKNLCKSTQTYANLPNEKISNSLTEKDKGLDEVRPNLDKNLDKAIILTPEEEKIITALRKDTPCNGTTIVCLGLDCTVCRSKLDHYCLCTVRFANHKCGCEGCGGGIMCAKKCSRCRDIARKKEDKETEKDDCHCHSLCNPAFCTIERNCSHCKPEEECNCRDKFIECLNCANDDHSSHCNKPKV